MRTAEALDIDAPRTDNLDQRALATVVVLRVLDNIGSIPWSATNPSVWRGFVKRGLW